MYKAKSVDQYISDHAFREEELKEMRQIMLDSGVEEAIKWGGPIYTYKGKNVAGLGAFKSYVGIWFHQGALLQDSMKKLICAQEGVTKALRQWRFENVEEIKANRDLIKAYVHESIENCEKGKEIKPAKKKPLVIPSEIRELVKTDSGFKTKFEAFSISCQREYCDYISEAKREETRVRRMEKIVPMILKGTGLNDKYK